MPGRPGATTSDRRGDDREYRCTLGKLDSYKFKSRQILTTSISCLLNSSPLINHCVYSLTRIKIFESRSSFPSLRGIGPAKSSHALLGTTAFLRH